MTRRTVLLLVLLALLAYYWQFVFFLEPPIDSAVGDELVKPPPRAVAAAVKLEVFARGFDQPVLIAHAPGDPVAGRLFVVEKTGLIRVVVDGKTADKPFLDFKNRISPGTRNINSEQGLLGLAFHPKFAANGRCYVNFTDKRGDTRVLELRVPDGGRAGAADPATEREVFFADQPFANHNGGHLAFGPDGLLYIGLGDGGGAGDPLDAGQNPKMLLGKMLRFDVNAGEDGAAPPGPDGRPVGEIVALGLRNPWRYSFDRKTGDLYNGDVGQNKYEEIDVIPAGSKNGLNFGWDIVEGMGHCFTRRNCDQSKFVLPVVEYDRNRGCSITGGHVYRGKAIPELDGCYFYADYCTALIRSFRLKDGRAIDQWEWRPVLDPGSSLATLSSFGEDAAGELYLVSQGGTIYRFEPAKAVR